MFNKIILGLTLFTSMFVLSVQAKELHLILYSPVKITTSDINLKEGDKIEFETLSDTYLNSKLYIKKGEKVSGIITYIEPNGFCCQEAKVYAENFKTKNINGEEIKLKGIISKKGRTHWMFTQFLPFIPELIRGGEVQITSKDRFTLYWESNNL
jgi:hypothetical protein